MKSRHEENAQRVLDALPAARAALRGAAERLNAPFYVRAWHQLKGDEGWGRGEELRVIMAIGALAAFFGTLWLFG